MKIQSSLLLLCALAALTAFDGWVCSARAATTSIDFETPTYTTTGGTGYADGNLTGQGIWSSGSTGTTGLDYLRVTANPITTSLAGDTSSQVLQLMDTGVSTATLYRTFNPAIGTTFNSTSTALSFSLQFNYDGAAFASTTSALLRFGFGGMGSGQNVNQIEFDSNGTLKYSYGGTSATTSAVTLGIWNTISGTIDYSTDTYTLFLNGTQLGGGSLAFITAATTAQAGGTALTDDINLKAMGATGTSFTSLAFDNLVVAAVPEPSEWMLGGLGLVVLGVRLRRAVRAA